MAGSHVEARPWPQLRRHRTTAFELCTVTDRGHQGAGGHRADTRNLLKTLNVDVVLRLRSLLPIMNCNHFIQLLQQVEIQYQRLHRQRSLQFGFASQHDVICKQKYDSLKARGKTHEHALRCVGDRLLKVLCAMLQNNTLYEPEQPATVTGA